MPRKRRRAIDTVEKEQQQIVFRFIVAPVIILLGVYVAGTFVESLFGVPKAATYIFAGVGGVGFVVVYFRNEIRRFMNREDSAGK